jgi:transcriptional regulator with XRE-family HTH domain
MDARRAVSRLTAELRDARLAASLSVDAAARSAGMSASQLSRLELDRLQRPDLEQLWRAASVVGLRPNINMYPVGSPLRDRAQLALLGRFERCLGSGLRMRREIPLPIQGDLRAWDALVEGTDASFFTEGESHVRDAQALERRLRGKMRDDPRARVVVLLLTRSSHHRAVLSEHREALRDLLPLDGAAVLRAIRAGRCPSASGIVLL